MPRGHHITHCQYCRKEYVCGDCITSNCEMGNDKRKCPEYQQYIRQREASANALTKLFSDPDQKKRGMGRLLAGLAWDDIAKELSDKELGDALLEVVWANMEIGTKEIALMEQAIDRLRGQKE